MPRDYFASGSGRNMQSKKGKSFFFAASEEMTACAELKKKFIHDTVQAVLQYCSQLSQDGVTNKTQVYESIDSLLDASHATPEEKVQILNNVITTWLVNGR